MENGDIPASDGGGPTADARSMGKRRKDTSVQVEDERQWTADRGERFNETLWVLKRRWIRQMKMMEGQCAIEMFEERLQDWGRRTQQRLPEDPQRPWPRFEDEERRMQNWFENDQRQIQLATEVGRQSMLKSFDEDQQQL